MFLGWGRWVTLCASVLDNMLILINCNIERECILVNLKGKYKQMSLTKRLLLLITLILSMIVIVLSICGIIGIVDSRMSNYISQPLVGIILSINGVLMYKKNKTVAMFLLCCVAFVLITYGIILVK